MTTPEPWGVHPVPDDGELTFTVGPLTLRVRRAAGELQALVVREGDLAEAAPPRWNRWAADDLDQVDIAPRFPDRPLVVEPEDPFWLLSGAEARIFVRVPTWIRVDALARRRHELLVQPTQRASDTWWGTPTEGELCYWLSTRARRALEPGDAVAHMIVCPLQLVNRSDDDLAVHRIALRTAYLSLYAAEEGLWSDETRVTYTGDAEGSRLTMAGVPPREVPDATLIGPPALKAARGFRARTFLRLRTLTGLFE